MEHEESSNTHMVQRKSSATTEVDPTAEALFRVNEYWEEVVLQLQANPKLSPREVFIQMKDMFIGWISSDKTKETITACLNHLIRRARLEAAFQKDFFEPLQKALEVSREEFQWDQEGKLVYYFGYPIGDLNLSKVGRRSLLPHPLDWMGNANLLYYLLSSLEERGWIEVPGGVQATKLFTLKGTPIDPEKWDKRKNDNIGQRAKLNIDLVLAEAERGLSNSVQENLSLS